MSEADELRDPDEEKMLKVKLPVHQHLDLRRIKVLSDQNMSETVEDAIRVYLEVLDDKGELDDLEEHGDLPEPPAS